MRAGQTRKQTIDEIKSKRDHLADRRVSKVLSNISSTGAIPVVMCRVFQLVSRNSIIAKDKSFPLTLALHNDIGGVVFSRARSPGSHLPHSPLGAALPQSLPLVWRLLNGGGDDQNNVVSSSLGNSIEAKKKTSTKKDEEPNVQPNKVEKSIAALDNNQQNCATETLESIAVKELLEVRVRRENHPHFTRLRIEPQSLRLQQSSLLQE
uniref:Uncharacterized protein n=1 Tax=Timema cristinae TaxID=61476 RepID=A0A7R9DCM1_TIMCR|nr:unnamed protein product [Timema cristinae]